VRRAGLRVSALGCVLQVNQPVAVRVGEREQWRRPVPVQHLVVVQAHASGPDPGVHLLGVLGAETHRDQGCRRPAAVGRCRRWTRVVPPLRAGPPARSRRRRELRSRGRRGRTPARSWSATGRETLWMPVVRRGGALVAGSGHWAGVAVMSAEARGRHSSHRLPPRASTSAPLSEGVAALTRAWLPSAPTAHGRACHREKAWADRDAGAAQAASGRAVTR
jgi:hypothetical protein